MTSQSASHRKAQLDKAEREHLEDVVTEMRERVMANVRHQLRQQGLHEEPDDVENLDEDTRELAEAIRLEAVDSHTWDEAFEEYVADTGATIVNRLAALRCMEVRDFLHEEVTVFKANGFTPAAETLHHEEHLLVDEALLRAYRDTCDELADEIEILFDRSTAYSLIDPDVDTFEDLCGMLDEVPDEVWRADDVLGWVYEYYNRPVVEALDAKNTLEPDDVGPANQFYTPHWVVRMLTDNSLGKLYLEATDQTDAIPDREALSPEQRKQREITPQDAPDLSELCTYLIPDEDEDDHEAPSVDHPFELRVIDPACGSGHFLLYAFDVLERIWWDQTDLDRGEIPAQILEHNLYGADIDLRSCQLAAFNLYLKARTRAEDEGNEEFRMPSLGIVCADARVAEVDEALDVLDEITGEDTAVRTALDEIIHQFQTTEGLGSLLDVQGTLSEEFMEEQTDIMEWGGQAPSTLSEFLRRLREAVDERTSDGFGEQNLKSFLNLLVVLTQDYDVALMNPPYGSGGRMPDEVQDYVDENYEYTTEYYINFFEACDRLTKTSGRTGMLVPRTFMFKKSLADFRKDFLGPLGSFDFLAEFGIGVLDKATVRTVGTVIRSSERTEGQSSGLFIRLHDVDADQKETRFIDAAFGSHRKAEIQRLFERPLSEFEIVPGTPLSYWVPPELRNLFNSNTVLDAENANLDRDGVGHIKQGLATADDSRFLRRFWETSHDSNWTPFAKGGRDAFLLPRVKHTVLWANEGEEVKRYSGSRPQNTQYYGREGLTYTVFKTTGRRFGYLHESSIFSHVGSALLPDRDIWPVLAFTNSQLTTYLMLCQTPERNWDVGLMAKVPWPSELEEATETGKMGQEALQCVLGLRRTDLASPYYVEPLLVSVLNESFGQEPGVHRHPHKTLFDQLPPERPERTLPPDSSLEDLVQAASKYERNLRSRLSSATRKIDRAVFDAVGITTEQREIIRDEIRARNSGGGIGETQNEPSAEGLVKDLLLDLTLRIVRKDDDGVVPISEVDTEDNLLSRIEDEFQRLFGEHASARLAEVDQVLGTQTAGEEAYPNLRTWLEDDLFDYHVSTFDRTPILWRLTTERLVSDPEGEGFACLVDYHQLDSGIFDRLQTRYLEPRKSLLREQKNAANRRRSDESLSTSEKADAAQTFAECESGLEQVAVFEDRVSELAQPSPRDWPQENQKTAEQAAQKVQRFRKETASRLDTLEDLANLDTVDMEELFSPSFYETVQDNRNEWLSALEDLQTAFEAYAADGSEPVEAHLYDLFEYYEDLVGSTHYASNGILFMTYYFDKLAEEPQAKLSEGTASKRKRLAGELSTGLEAYKELSEEIKGACNELAKSLDSEWTKRALEEITTRGYQPNLKHGVAINIRPLAEAELVPETVEDDVL